MKRKLIVIFGIVCSMGLLACNSTESSVAETGGTKAESVAESVAPAGPINVKDYYTVVQEGNEQKYTFDTTMFDQGHFNGKWHLGEVDISLPLGSVKEIQEAGVDVSRESYCPNPEEDLLVNEKLRDPMIEAKEQCSLNICMGMLDEDYIDEMTGRAVYYNETDAEVNVIDAEIDYLEISIRSDEKSMGLAKILGMDENVLTVDSVVAAFGLPIYYTEDGSWNELELYYYYGDYTLIFTSAFQGSDAGIVKGMKYTSQKNIDYECELGYETTIPYAKACEKFDG